MQIEVDWVDNLNERKLKDLKGSDKQKHEDKAYFRDKIIGRLWLKNKDLSTVACVE